MSKMNSVLHDLGFRNPLKRYVRGIWGLALEVDELRRRSQLALDLDAQKVGPEWSQAFGIGAVDLYPSDSSDGLTANAISHASRHYGQELLK
jgi:hypothetical protein